MSHNELSNTDLHSLEVVASRVYSGNTILFLGAGFSLGSQNVLGTKVPLATELSRSICELGNFEVDEDLAYSADYFLKNNDPEQLIDLLKKAFTVAVTEQFHEEIASKDWRRIYTTNYDNCFEFAAAHAQRTITSVSLEHNPTTYARNRNVCVHINGDIQWLDSDSLESSFKLTESSYTHSDAFADSSWSYRFKKDLEICSQIIFVGYSLYDMEIRRLLVKSKTLKHKTYFITSENTSRKLYHRLSAYGTVFPINTSGFAEILKAQSPPPLPKDKIYLSSLIREEPNFDVEYTDTDIRDFLLRGKTDPNYILASLTASSQLYAIERKSVQKALEFFDSTNVIIIHSTLANGKTVFAQQMIAHLLMESKYVYSINDEDADYERDIDILSRLNHRIYLFIDDFEKRIDIVRYATSVLGDSGKLILTERPRRYRRASKELAQLGISFYNINTDYLHDSEINQMADVLTNIGLWGEFAGKGKMGQFKYLKRDCEAQISIILLKLLNAPSVKDRFRLTFQIILKHPATKTTAHAICLIQHIYPTACTYSFISNIAGTNHVYSKEFEERILESGLFAIERGKISTRSSVFGMFILSELYSANYSIDQIVRVIRKLGENYRTRSFEERELERSLMTFGTLSRILPQENKTRSYVRFYEKLKSEVPYVKRNPHYWLQYAMALMSVNNLEDAERYLNTAYSQANARDGYDTSYIDNQYARLSLRKALVETEPHLSIGYFMEAHNILRREEDDVYKFRPAKTYVSYYEQRYLDLPKKHQVTFEHAIKEITKHFERYLREEYPYIDPPPYQVENLAAFQSVIDQIVEQRR